MNIFNSEAIKMLASFETRIHPAESQTVKLEIKSICLEFRFSGINI